MKLDFIKTVSGLTPASDEARKWLANLKGGEVCSGEFRKKQNAKFHRKLFALLQLGFDNWEQPTVEIEVGGATILPEKNFDRFRKDVVILAGFYNTVFRLDGSYRVEAVSLSFSKMSAEKKERLYQKIIDVLLNHVYGSDMDKEKLDNMVNAYLSFV